MTALTLLFGLLLGTALVAFARFGPCRELLVLSIALWVAAGAYVVFAGCARSYTWFSLELGGALFFCTFAFLGLRSSPWYLIIGWTLHPLWDVGLHLRGAGALYTPGGYALACLSFDLIVAGYMILQVLRKDPLPG